MDEDDLSRQSQDLPESEGEYIPEFPRKAGYRRGGKLKGSGRNRWEVAMLESIARGDKQAVTGPTFKPTSAKGWIAERLRAFELYKEAKDGQDKLRDVPAEADLRALIGDLAKQYGFLPQPPPPQPEPEVIREGDSEIVSLDKEQTAPKRDVEKNPQVGDRIELGEGFYALYVFQDGTGHGNGLTHWLCYPPPPNTAGHYAVKPTAQACREHFYKYTTAGRELAEREGLR